MASDFLVIKIYERLAGRDDWVPREELTRDLMAYVPPGLALRRTAHDRTLARARYRRKNELTRASRPRERSLQQDIHSGQRRVIGSLLTTCLRYGVLEQEVHDGKPVMRLRRPPRAVIGLWSRHGTFQLLTDEEAEALDL